MAKEKSYHIPKSFKIGFAVLVLISALFVFLAVEYIFSPKELEEGSPAPEFCKEDCGENFYVNSNNNSEYGFIRCECHDSSATTGHNSPISGQNRGKSIVSFFDSGSLEKISKDEAISKIENKS